jgi:hypothetical protein
LYKGTADAKQCSFWPLYLLSIHADGGEQFVAADGAVENRHSPLSKNAMILIRLRGLEPLMGNSSHL